MKILRHLFLLLSFFTSLSLHAQWNSRGPNGGAVYDFYRSGGQLWAATSGGVFFSGNDGLFWTNPARLPSAFGCADVVRTVAAMGQEIYAGTSVSGVFHSNNGGTDWTGSPSMLPLGIPYTDLEIFPNAAFVVRGDSGVLYASPDHGLSWQRVLNLTGNPRVRYLSQNNNVLYLTTTTGLYSSANQGNNFSLVNSASDLGRMVWSGDTLFIATTTGIRSSTDYGATLTPLAGSTGRSLSLVAASGQNVYSAVAGVPAPPDTLLYSTNGGAGFSSSPVPDAARIYTIMAGNAPGTVIIGTDYGILRSANGGLSWNRGDSGLHATAIRSLAISGSNIYAAAYPMGIFFSADSTSTWQHRGNRAAGIEGDVRAVAARNNIVHGGGASGYYRSTNFGNTWSHGAAGLPASGVVTSILATPGTANVLLVDSGNLYASTNDGASFSAVPGNGLPANGLYLIIAADTGYFAIASGTLYHAGSNMVFTAASGITSFVTSAVFMDSLYYAGTVGNGIYISRNGLAWTAMTYPAPYTSNIRVLALANDSGDIFAGTDNGILRITPAGLSGTPTITPEGLQGHNVSALAVMSHHLFAGTCNGVWTTPFPQPQPNSVGTAPNASDGMQLYPNPARASFTIRLTSASADRATLTIRNMLGAMMQRQDIRLHAGENRMSADVAELPAGIYTVQVAAPGAAVQSARLVIVR